MISLIPSNIHSTPALQLQPEQQLIPGHGWVRISKIISTLQGFTGLRLGPLHTDDTCSYLDDRSDSDSARTAVIEVNGPVVALLPHCKRCASTINRAAQRRQVIKHER